ncbi:MAG: hypothetical protein HY875_12405 [Chloroflexi bacterium]|nr:hypothetical protein [Chloroflexota bacterium]
MSAERAIPAELLTRAHLGFVDAFRLLGRSAPGGAVDEAEGATCAASGIPTPSFNRLFLVEPPPNPAVTLARARAFFTGLGLPWSVIATPEAAAAIAGEARGARLQRSSPVPGMLLPQMSLTERPIPGFEIRVVDGPAIAEDFVLTASEGFGAPRRIFDVFCHPAVAKDPDMTLYVGYAAGIPVATATRVSARRVAGVYNISTLRSHRGRGYGEAITARAVLGGVAEGCVASFLQATQMGYPVYERMGFRQVVEYQVWEAR